MKNRKSLNSGLTTINGIDEGILTDENEEILTCRTSITV